MEIFGKTDIGKVRDINQDNFAFETINDDVSFAIVCDGMGGPNGGHIASEIAVNVLRSDFFNNLKIDLNLTQLREVVDGAFNKANSEILNLSNSDKKLIGMGTTVVGSVILKNHLHIFNIGDSRAYIFNDAGLKQLTVDHSYVQTLIDCGKLSPSEAKSHPRKNEITKAMGIAKNLNYDFSSFVKNKGEYLLLCSDGLTNVCSDEVIFEILNSKKNLKQKVISLIDCANDNGGCDNVTVVLIKM